MAAYAVIDDFVVPESLPVGSDVTVRILLRNTGDSGRLDYYIDGNPSSPDRYMMVESGRTPTDVLPGSTIWIDVSIRYFKMPAWNFNLTASNEDGTSSLRRTIVLISADYALTIWVTPGTGEMGDVFDFSGTLTLNESPVLNEWIDLVLEGVGKVADALTGADGRYSCLWVADREGTLRFHTEAPMLAMSDTVSLFVPSAPEWLVPAIIGSLPVAFAAAVVVAHEVEKIRG